VVIPTLDQDSFGAAAEREVAATVVDVVVDVLVLSVK